ncbi:hypothetical protein DAD186_16780 [Dermabacter vaginalis]|uniref:Uncharacterized protein n=1 Tax=Dermabacter vaginalis TaxID=1630135 RepID=A0A1B0ZK17_9MICO|nr:hypothetical protein DAD186_16780 [Dermabacter vaginalis]
MSASASAQNALFTHQFRPCAPEAKVIGGVDGEKQQDNNDYKNAEDAGDRAGPACSA